MKRIVSKVKRRRIFVEKDGRIKIEKAVVMTLNEENFMIFDTNDTNIMYNGNQIEITMWFRNTRPWDEYHQLDMKPDTIKIFLCRQSSTPIFTFKLKNCFFSYLGFYNIILHGEALQDRSYYDGIL